VIITSDVDRNPRLVDFDIDDGGDWYDASSEHMNHSELFDAFLNYTGRTTKLEVSSIPILGLTLLLRISTSGFNWG
jgi:hypothetical protein